MRRVIDGKRYDTGTAELVHTEGSIACPACFPRLSPATQDTVQLYQHIMEGMT